MARSTRRDDGPGRESEGGRVVLALILGLALLAGGAYGAACLAASDRLPVGTKVAGVDIGGRHPSAAVQALRDGLSARADTPFTVVIDGRAQQVRPSQAGLGVDYAASVGKAAPVHGWRPSYLWTYFTGGSSYQPVVTLDQDRLAALLRRLDLTDGRVPSDGGVVFTSQGFRVRAPHPGLTLDPRQAGTAFWHAYLAGGSSVRLQLRPVAPAIDMAAINRFVRRFANRAVSSPLDLRFGSTTLHLSPAAYGRLLVARRVGAHLRPWVRSHALAHLTDARLSGAAIGRPRPATIALVGGVPQVVSAKPGVRYRPRDVASALLRAITAGNRTAQVRATIARASFTDADALALAIRQPLASFSASLPGGSHHGRLAAAVGAIDQTVLKPGDSLSLRGLLGSATPSGASGDALATAVFNAAWLGGLRVTAHAPGATYTDAAPLGRDASLRHGQDVAFTDDTTHGVLVQVTTTHQTMTVTLWSSPRWQVTSSHGPRTHVVPAGRLVSHLAGCVPSQGRDGFDVTVTRSLSRGGRVARTSSYTVQYAPLAAVVCRGAHHRHHHHH